jgi:hypothetical protein
MQAMFHNILAARNTWGQHHHGRRTARGHSPLSVEPLTFCGASRWVYGKDDGNSNSNSNPSRGNSRCVVLYGTLQQRARQLFIRQRRSQFDHA